MKRNFTLFISTFAFLVVGVFSATGQQVTTSTHSVQICKGDSIYLQNAFQTQQGVYYDSTETVDGGLNIVITKLGFYPRYSTLVQRNLCMGDSLFFAGSWIRETGVYSWKLQTIHGCDSIIKLSLTAIQFKPTIRRGENNMLYAAPQGAQYQWIDCVTGESILGATLDNFELYSNSDYAVEVTIDGCTIRSACFTAVMTGLDQPKWMGNVSLYPNPTVGDITISLPDNGSPFTITLLNALGQKINSISTTKHKVGFSLKQYGSGIYFIKIINKGETGHLRAVVQ